MSDQQDYRSISSVQFQSALLADGILRDGDMELLHTIDDPAVCPCTTQELVVKLGYKSEQSFNVKIGNLSKRIATYLHVEAPSKTEGRPEWWMLLAEADRNRIVLEDGRKSTQYIWKGLRTELHRALLNMNV